MSLLRETAGADFLSGGIDPPTRSAIRGQLLDPGRLSKLARSWIETAFPDATPFARRLFVALHEESNRNLMIPEVAHLLDSHPRTLRRHAATLAGGTPRNLRLLGRLVRAGLEIARDSVHPIAWNITAAGFLDYPVFFRAFKRMFETAPRRARHLLGPAPLWARWSHRSMVRTSQRRPAGS